MRRTEEEWEIGFEALVQDFLAHEFAAVPDFIPSALVGQLRADLQERLETGQMKPAGIGQHLQFQHNTAIRGDSIFWLDPSSVTGAESAYLDILDQLMRYLNETCFTGLNGCECHYAWYDTGSFYKRHLDQFRSDTGRKYSVILYLNENWKEDDGGQLVIYKNNEAIRIRPEGGTLVFFQSDRLEHEVLPAMRPRMSVTGWLKKRHPS